jgi:NPCBM/NEW2 domain
MERDEIGSWTRGPIHGWLPPATLALLLTLLPGGRAPARDSSTDGADPIFTALLIDGRSHSGRIVSLGETGVTIATREGKKEKLPLDQLVKLTRDSQGAMAAGENTQAVLLAEGDRLMRATIFSATDASLELKSEILGKLEVPLDSILGMILKGSGPAENFESLRNQVLFESRSSEVVWLNNGDRLEGSFLGMDERAIKLQVGEKPVEIERSGAVAMGFDPALIRYPRPKGAFLEATLSDGTRIGLASARLVEGNVEATTRFGKAVRFPVTTLTRLHSRSASVIYLSERKPAAAQYDSYIGPSRPYRVDRAVDGHPIQLGGQTYDRGIGTESRSLIAFRIEPGDRRFQALIGVDERAGPPGSVVFRVLVDRQERFKSAPMTDRDPSRSLDIDLAGGKVLILVTEFGERGNVRDLADWAEARIVR